MRDRLQDVRRCADDKADDGEGGRHQNRQNPHPVPEGFGQLAIRREHQQIHSLRRQAEHHRHEEGRQGVFPGLHHRAEGLAAADRGRGEGCKSGGRRHVREHGIVEHEHVRGWLGDADLHQRRHQHHGCYDVARRHWHGEPEYPHGNRGEEDHHQPRAAAELHDDARQGEAKPGEIDHAHDDAGAGAGGDDAERGARAIGHGLDHARGVGANGRAATAGLQRLKAREGGGCGHGPAGADRAAAIEQLVQTEAERHARLAEHPGDDTEAEPHQIGADRHEARVLAHHGEREGDGDRPEYGHEGRESERQKDRDRSQRKEVVALALRQLPQRGVGGLDGLDVEAARVGFCHQPAGQVIEDGRDRRVDQDHQVADVEIFGDDEGCGPQRGRRERRADAGGGEKPSADMGRIARALEHRPGQGRHRDGGRDARPGDGAEQEAGGDDGAAGRGGRRLLAEQGEGPVDEEAARAAAVEHRAIEREQDDEGRRHVHGRREDALKGQIVLPDDAVEREATMVEGLGHGRPEIAVDKEQDRHRRQDPANGAARRLQDEGDQGCAQHDVVRARPCGAGLDLLGVDREMHGAPDGDDDEEPVEDLLLVQPAAGRDEGVGHEREADQHSEPAREGAALEDAALGDDEGHPADAKQGDHQLLDGDAPGLCIDAAAHQRIEKENQRERERQEARAIEGGVDRELRPVERVGREAETGRAGEPAHPAADPLGGPAFRIGREPFQFFGRQRHCFRRGGAVWRRRPCSSRCAVGHVLSP